jgi:oxaloacetate decarboxylase beta subunit
MNIVNNDFLGLSVGSKMEASHFLNLISLGIWSSAWWLFSIGYAAACDRQMMNKLDPKHPVNPIIGKCRRFCSSLRQPSVASRD